MRKGLRCQEMRRAVFGSEAENSYALSTEITTTSCLGFKTYCQERSKPLKYFFDSLLQVMSAVQALQIHLLWHVCASRKTVQAKLINVRVNKIRQVSSYYAEVSIFIRHKLANWNINLVKFTGSEGTQSLYNSLLFDILFHFHSIHSHSQWINLKRINQSAVKQCKETLF